MLKIKGRIKELLVTAGGENGPRAIEDYLRRPPACPQHRRSAQVPLGPLHAEAAPNEDTFDDVLVGAAARNPEVTTAAASETDYAALLQAAIDDYNKEKATSSAERVQKLASCRYPPGDKALTPRSTQKGGSRRKVRGRAQAALRRRAKRCVVPLTRSPLYARPKRRLCD